MAESPRRVDLRLTIPTAAPYAGLAGEIASRFAAYSGASQGDAEAVGRAVESIASRARVAAAESITLVGWVNDEIIVETEVGGRTERITCPLT